MKTEKVCSYCTYFPLCHAMWNVDPAHPCKHITGKSMGFFRPKSELAALEADNAAMREKTIEECARIAGESERAGAKWLEQWDRGIGSRMGPLDDDERIAFSHGDFICDQIRALTPDSGKVLVDEDMIRGEGGVR